MSLVELNEQAKDDNEERCERLPQSKGSSLAPMVADLRSARVGRCQAIKSYGCDEPISRPKGLFFMSKIKVLEHVYVYLALRRESD
nr:hypothetical protein [Staphylococcus sp. NRL 22/194]